MSPSDYFRPGRCYWCKDYRGEVSLARCEGVQDESRGVLLRQVDDTVCDWPMRQVSSDPYTLITDWPRDRHVEKLLARWGVEDFTDQRNLREAFDKRFKPADVTPPEPSLFPHP